MSDLRDIEQRAKDLYISGQHETLTAAFAQLPATSHTQYPNLLVQIAKLYIYESRHNEAEHLLYKALSGYSNDPDGQVRVWVLICNIAQRDTNTSLLATALAEAERVAEQHKVSLTLQAEIAYQRGDFERSTKPRSAVNTYRRAADLFKAATRFDQANWRNYVRAAGRLAELAISQGMLDVGRHYLTAAEDEAQRLQDERLTFWLLTIAADCHIWMGEYQAAWERLESASTTTSNEQRNQVIWRKAWLAWLMWDNEKLLNVLESREVGLQSHFTGARVSILKGYLSLEHEFTPTSRDQRTLGDAGIHLEEALFFAGGDNLLLHNCHILAGCIDGLRDEVREGTLENLIEAADFFSTNRMLVEASQANLVLAWLTLKLSYLEQCVKQIGILGHAKHLARLHELCGMVLSPLWVNIPGGAGVVTQMREFLRAVSAGIADDRTRVKAFGYPQVLRGQTALEGLNRQLMIVALLEAGGQASRDKLMSDFWPDTAHDNARKNLGMVKVYINQFYPGLIKYGGGGEYSLAPGFPSEYDVHLFRQHVTRARQHKRLSARLGEYMRAFNLYDIFLKGSEGEWVERRRAVHQAFFKQALDEAIELAAQHGEQEFAERWRSMVGFN